MGLSSTTKKYKQKTNTEDRQQWYKKADGWELKFVEKFGEKFGVRINPFKDDDKMAPDLICSDSVFADLKYQSAPFFMADKLYNVNVQYSWTMNEVDFMGYAYKHYDKFKIFIWSHFKENMEYNGVQVDAMNGVWLTDMSRLRELIGSGPPLHAYMKRKYGYGNAKDSYVLDLSNDKYFTRLI